MVSWLGTKDQQKDDPSLAKENADSKNEIDDQLVDNQSYKYPALPSVHLYPGHFLVGVSLPLFIRAYRLYHSPLESLQEKATKKKLTVAELKEADVGIRRAVGMAVAGRALKVATLSCFGFFSLTSAGKCTHLLPLMSFHLF